MTTKMHWTGRLLAVLGLLCVLTEFGAYEYYSLVLHQHHDISPWIAFGGAIIGFIGFYILSPKRAKDAAAFIIDKSTGVVIAIRTGKRRDDVVPVVPVTPAEPPIVVDKEPPHV